MQISMFLMRIMLHLVVEFLVSGCYNYYIYILLNIIVFICFLNMLDRISGLDFYVQLQDAV